MSEMTTHERFTRMFAHEPADRVPIIDAPWGTTIERWHKEGLPADVAWDDYFQLDKTADIGLDNSPHFPSETIEETDEYRIFTTGWGVTAKTFKHMVSTPDFLDFTVVDPESWAIAKKRMTPTRDRIAWDHLKTHYQTWRDEGRWISANLWFGFDVTHSWMVGTERVLMAMIEQPEWLIDIFNHQLDVQIALLEMLYAEGYTVDMLAWPDDLGYKGTTFFSVDAFRNILKPVQKRACDWAHAHGIVTHLHSCGNIRQLIREFIDAGIDALNPLEVKAGLDPLEVKQEFGQQLVLHGGINAMLWDDTEAITTEMRRIVPELKKDGGFIFSSDHSIPDAVSFEDIAKIIELAKELGSY